MAKLHSTEFVDTLPNGHTLKGRRPGTTKYAELYAQLERLNHRPFDQKRSQDGPPNMATTWLQLNVEGDAEDPGIKAARRWQRQIANYARKNEFEEKSGWTYQTTLGRTPMADNVFPLFVRRVKTK